MMTPNNMPQGIKNVIDLDKNLRKSVTEYYFALCKLNDPLKAVELLAGHVAIMVEMINELKKGK